MQKKENLVLIHSFPTNSILLSGLIHFLEDYFNVYPIDLPGFIRTKPPIEKISIQAFSDYLDKELVRLDLEHYVVAGVSFGYWVVGNAKLTRGCRGVLALEPYVGWRSMRISMVTHTKRIYYLVLIAIVRLLNLYGLVWKSKIWKRAYTHISGNNSKRTKIVFREIEAKTFIRCAGLLLSYNSNVGVHDLPTILVINPHDKTLDSSYIRRFFADRSSKLLVIESDIGHYPRKVTKEYFHKNIKKNMIERINSFLDSYG